MDAFIDDGYTENVGIEPVEGLHPGMEFVYRPFAGDEGERAFREVYVGPTALKKAAPRPNVAKEKKRLQAMEAEQQPEAQRARLFALLMERVASWSLSRPFTAENIARLQPALFARFTSIVMGYDENAVPDYRLDMHGNRIEATEDDIANDLKNS